MAEINLFLGNILPLLQSTSFERPDGLYTQGLTQSLTIVQSVVVANTNSTASQVFTISQSLAVNKILQQSVGHFLPINSRGVRVKEAHTSNLLSLSHSSKKSLPHTAVNALVFTQLAEAARGLENALVFTQSANVNIVKIVTISHTLAFDQGVAALLDNNWQFTGIFTPIDIADYDPSQLNIPPTPAVSVPVQFIGGGVTLIFDNVDFGNVASIEHTRISRRARGENLIVYRDPRWPKTEILKFKLQDLSALEGKSILTFIGDTLAQEIEFFDWLGVRWLGVIISPEASLVQSVRDQRCGSGRYEIQLEFQGVQAAYA